MKKKFEAKQGKSIKEIFYVRLKQREFLRGRHEPSNRKAGRVEDWSLIWVEIFFDFLRVKLRFNPIFFGHI